MPKLLFGSNILVSTSKAGLVELYVGMVCFFFEGALLYLMAADVLVVEVGLLYAGGSLCTGRSLFEAT